MLGKGRGRRGKVGTGVRKVREGKRKWVRERMDVERGKIARVSSIY